MLNENREQTQEVKEEKKDNSPISEASFILEELKKQNEIFQKNLQRQEEITAKQMLSGRSSSQLEEQPKEDTPKEYAQKAIKGGFNNGKRTD